MKHYTDNDVVRSQLIELFAERKSRIEELWSGLSPARRKHNIKKIEQELRQWLFNVADCFVSREEGDSDDQQAVWDMIQDFRLYEEGGFETFEEYYEDTQKYMLVRLRRGENEH